MCFLNPLIERVQQHPVFAWILLFFASLNVTVFIGKQRAFGVFVSQWHAEFNATVTLTELNWIGESDAALACLTGTCVTALVLNFHNSYKIFQGIGAILILLSCVTSSFVPNPHYLFITNTVLFGVGYCIIISVVPLVISEYFGPDHKYHILAMTLPNGGCAGGAALVKLFAFLIENYNWRNALLIMGAIYFVVALSGAVLFESNKNNQIKPTTLQKTNNTCNYCTELCRSSGITKMLVVLWLVDRIISTIVLYGLVTNLSDFARRTTHSSLIASSLLPLLYNLGEVVIYVFFVSMSAFTEDLLKGKLRHILLIATAILVILFPFWEFYSHKPYVNECMSFFSGACIGPSFTFLFPAALEITTLPVEYSIPLSFIGFGIGIILSPIVTALIAELFAYKWFFLTQSIVLSVKVSVLVAIVIIHNNCVSQKPTLSYKKIDSTEDDNLFVEENKED